MSATAFCLLLAACGGQPRAAGGTKAGVRVASFDFAESRVLAELYAQALERAGIPVVRHIGLASREEVEPALEQGMVDLVPEYTGTALTFLEAGGQPATSDAAATYSRLQSAFASRGVTALVPSPAADQNALAVTRATADRLHLSRVSDLSPVASSLVLGGPPECPQRQFCLPGLTSVYGLRFKSFRPLDTAGPLTVGALQGNEIDVAPLFTPTARGDTAGVGPPQEDRRPPPAAD